MSPGRRALAGLLLALTVCACASAPPTPEARHILWRATPPGGLEGEVHLLGSIHVGRGDLLALPPVMREAFDRSDRVVFEADVDRMLDAVFSTLRYGFFWDGRTLKDALSPMAWERIEDNAVKLGPQFDLETNFVFRRIKPWMLALLLSSGELAEEGFTGEAGVDRVLMEASDADAKERLYFETVGEQLRLFDRLSFEDQERFLLESLGYDPEGEPMEDEGVSVEEMADAWRRGDADALAALMAEGFGPESSFSRILLHERNESWANQLPGLLEPDSPLLVVVGAGHLVGDGSLVEILRERGWRVTQL